MSMTPRRKRLVLFGSVLVGVAVAAGIATLYSAAAANPAMAAREVLNLACLLAVGAALAAAGLGAERPSS